ncbi:MAG TPA: DUF4142 domain-containing protein [Xanthomonadaceae bacterium]|jgi:putative membrane protein|nr:DUF4142 domain-containing protein [Xanthomonadaceae bacterium]
MTHRIQALATAVVVAALTITVAHAAGTAKPAAPTAPAAPAAPAAKLNSSDHTFLADALESNQLDIDVSAYAAKQADSAKVKQFAQAMATEHTKLAALMQKANDGLIPTPAPTTQPGINLQGREGAELDHSYVDLMVDYEQDAVTKFRSGADGPQYSGAIHDMAKSVLPSLQRDEATAKAMQRALGPR